MLAVMQAEVLEYVVFVDLTVPAHSIPVVAVYLLSYTSYMFSPSLMSSYVGISSGLSEFAHFSCLYLNRHVSL